MAPPGLLRLLPRVDLYVETWRAALALDLVGQPLGEALPIHRLDDVEEVERGANLVGLQGSDQPELEAGPARVGPSSGRLLDAVLSEYGLARREHRLDRRPRLLFGNRRQGDIGGSPTRGDRRRGDPLPDPPQPTQGVVRNVVCVVRGADH